ncbi:hypothetical protein NFI96_021455, partial [Prochilodus magdalenae]
SVRSSRAFMGLLLQARSVPEDHVVGGEFTMNPPGTHTFSCISNADTITHSDKLLKRNLSFTWRAPAQPSGDMRFYITVVHSYFVYWSRIRSAIVHDGTRRTQGANYDAGLQTRIISGSPGTALTLTSRERERDSSSEAQTPSETQGPPSAPDGKVFGSPEQEPTAECFQSLACCWWGCPAGLGMAVAVGPEVPAAEHCRRHTAMSLGERSHGNRGVIHVQECGDLVQVRRIRENSFLLLQAEYNLIAAPGN